MRLSRLRAPLVALLIRIRRRPRIVSTNWSASCTNCSEKLLQAWALNRGRRVLNPALALLCGLTEISLDGNIQDGYGKQALFQALDSGRRNALRAEVAELADALHSGCS